ncbi:TetR/AcrR family transcriptional regulator [Dictyobacter arantiisoli]|uniref:Transcriptional regulator n=1 Tax=Dictyobacter arantiisoli TaxID=2014874 RepID=A0A5A5TAE5_9CHLR|nr:TetR/AcrR family transcriptional regulator [Dictyobacter arantiisoli]GCF08368.1 transcriptional regulator [Dictyobacter arantiisoli]
MVTGASDRDAATHTRRQAILDAALTLFSTKGFTETTMEDIRRLSGASTGSIYHHFENKEMLARALYLDGRNDLNRVLLTSFKELPVDALQPRTGIKAFVYAYLDWFEQHPDLGQFFMQAADTEYLGAYIKVLRQKILTTLPIESFPEQFLLWLTPYIEEGIIVRLPQSLYYPLVIGASREFVRRWLRTRLPEEIQEVREPLAEAAWIVLASPIV